MRPLPRREPAVFAYCRLSRDDLRGPGATADKLEDRAQVCRDLAAAAGLALPEEHILRERQSGGALSNRPELLTLLQRAAGGEVTHLITPFQDRLSRGDKRDDAAIEEALCLGRVTLITTQGVTEYGPDYNPLIHDVLAAAARYERLVYIARRRAANAVKLKANKRVCGRPPYGYRLLRATYDPEGRLLTPARYEPVPAEYAIVEELFRRAPTETLCHLAADLNARGIRPPLAGKHYGPAAAEWTRQAVKTIVRNPFYAGYHSQRSRVEGVGAAQRRVMFGVNEYVLAEEEGDWPHPVSLEQWYALMARLESRGKARAHKAPTPRRTLLTGILYCSQGHAMVKRAPHTYACLERRHGGAGVKSDSMDEWARAVVDQVLANLPEQLLEQQTARKRTPRSERSERATLQAQYARARQELREAEESVDDLMINRRRYAGQFSEESFARAARKAEDALSQARAETQRLEALLAEPDRAETLSLLAEVRGLGDDLWRVPMPLQRQIVAGVIRRIQMLPVKDEEHFQRGCTLTLWPWARPYFREWPPYHHPRRRRWLTYLSDP